MSEVNANIVIEPIELSLTADNNQINITPADIQLNVYTAGMGTAGAGGSNGQLQFNNSGVLGGAANTLVNANGNVRFTNISNLKINGGSTGYFLQTDGSGNLTWANGTANITGNGTAAGSNNQIQLSDGAGNFKVGAGFSFDPSSNILLVPGDIYASNVIGTLANGNSNISITANSNVTITVNSNVSATISDNRITTPAITVNSSNIALGNLAGANGQSNTGIAIGYNAGNTNQGSNSIAIGYSTANYNQGYESIAIGGSAGGTNQGNSSIAIGYLAGGANLGGFGQNDAAVAIGPSAGEFNQGIYSIAIGFAAGRSQQPNNSIVLNASGSNLNVAQQQAFYVKPVRNANTANVLFYDDTTGEITYDLKPSSSSISNGNSNVNVPTINGNVTVSVNGNSNIAVFTGTGANINGTLTVTGNINGNLVGTVLTSAQPNITSLGNLTSLTVTGNITSGNVSASGNVTGARLVSTQATGTAPLSVSSTTRVANLNVDRANLADIITVTNYSAPTNTYIPLVTSSATGNRSLLVNANLRYVSSTGNLYTNNMYVDNYFISPVIPFANIGGTITQGSRTLINDANTTTFYSIVSGGGANVVPIYYDGTNWRVG